MEEVDRRRHVLLGKYGSPESKAEYARIVEECRVHSAIPAAGPRAPDLTVNELVLAFIKHAECHYRGPDGRPTSELAEYRRSLGRAVALYGHIRAADFGPLALKAVRQSMIGLGWCRGVINQRVGRIVRAFKWAASEELVPVIAFQAQRTVSGLSRGRSAARESDPVAPVPAEFVEATLPYLMPPVRAMVRIQLLTSMRPGEVCQMRACDIDMSGPVWHYRPARHKTAWRGKARVIPLGPLAQAVVRSFLTRKLDDFLFRPVDGKAANIALSRAKRRTKIYPCEIRRLERTQVKTPKRRPGERYSTSVYCKAIERAVERANQVAATAAAKAGQEPSAAIPHWHPNQLRHTAATEVRRRYGLEAAQVVLGHSTADVTQVCAERDLALAVRVAVEMG